LDGGVRQVDSSGYTLSGQPLERRLTDERELSPQTWNTTALL